MNVHSEVQAQVVVEEGPSYCAALQMLSTPLVKMFVP